MIIKTLKTTKVKNKTEPPKKFGVLMLNDNITSFKFVERCLVEFFGKSKEEAHFISGIVHSAGKTVVLGPWTLEIAEELCFRTMDRANKVGYPFVCDPIEV